MPFLHPLRLLVLFLALASFLTTVVWYGFFRGHFFEPVLRRASMGRPVPAFFTNPRIGRAWNGFVVALLLLLWWFLGTPAAIRLTRKT